MSQETLKMSAKERARMVVMERHRAGEITLKEAAWEMGVCMRQAVRIKRRYTQQGAEGLLHRARGMPSNHAAACALRRRAVELYRRHYPDFGPTLAAEKMAERDNFAVNHETLRRWLIAEGLWRVGCKERIHRKRRKRRGRFGELLQLDGSDHDWLEDRGPRCTLMVLIDDATGTLMLRMAPGETTEAALALLRQWIERHGVPAALYADRSSVYFTDAWVNLPRRREDPATHTRFMRCARRLGVGMIPAHSPQAKGRVERANATLQDRLVKELRLRGVRTIAAANAMLGEYAERLNQRFAREPADPANAHRAAPAAREQWDYFFCFEETRKVQRDNTVVHRGQRWQILPQHGAPAPGAAVTLRIPLDGGEPYWLRRQQRLETRKLESVPSAKEHRPAGAPRAAAGASPRPPGI